MNFRCKFRQRLSSPWPWFPDFLADCKISAIWWRFPLIFAFYMLNVRHISTSGFVWPTGLESIPHASTPTSIIPTKFEVDITTHCRVIAFLSADTSRDLVTLTFNLLTLNSSHTWRVTWPTLPLKFEDPKTIRSWVTSYNVSHWLALEMRTRPLRMRRITWPVSRESKTITYLESPTPICLFTIQLPLGYDDD